MDPQTLDTAHHAIGSQLSAALLVAYVLQWAKQSNVVPWISEHTKGLNRVLTGLTSLVAAVGISYTFDASTGVLTIGGLHASALATGAWTWVQQWALQQGAADMILTKATARGDTVDAPPPASL